MLTSEQLEALEQSWRAAQAPIANSLRPGISVDEVHSAFEEFPAITIPRELEVWWGWHDGADPARGSDLIGGENAFISVAQAVAEYREEFDFLEEEEEHLLQWVRSARPWLRIECTPDSPDTGQIWADPHGEEFRLVLPSLGELVEVWTDAVDTGLFLYNLSGPFPTGIASERIDPQDVVLNTVL